MALYTTCQTAGNVIATNTPAFKREPLQIKTPTTLFQSAESFPIHTTSCANSKRVEPLATGSSRQPVFEKIC